MQHADALSGEAQGNRDDGVGALSRLFVDPFEVPRIGGHVQRAIDLTAGKRLPGFAACAGNGHPLAGALAPFFEQLAGLAPTRRGEEQAGSFGVMQQYAAIGRVGHAACFLQNRPDELLLIDVAGQLSGGLQEGNQFFFGQIVGTHHCSVRVHPSDCGAQAEWPRRNADKHGLKTKHLPYSNPYSSGLIRGPPPTYSLPRISPRFIQLARNSAPMRKAGPAIVSTQSSFIAGGIWCGKTQRTYSTPAAA